MFLHQERKKTFNLYNQITKNELHLGDLSEIRKKYFQNVNQQYTDNCYVLLTM